tara:strand:+ start:1224 stop:1397 length:174 start_codon:yes stop_codon:yes gene_type:complete
MGSRIKMIFALALTGISTASVFARTMRDVSPVAMSFWQMAIGAGVTLGGLYILGTKH